MFLRKGIMWETALLKISWGRGELLLWLHNRHDPIYWSTNHSVVKAIIVIIWTLLFPAVLYFHISLKNVYVFLTNRIFLYQCFWCNQIRKMIVYISDRRGWEIIVHHRPQLAERWLHEIRLLFGKEKVSTTLHTRVFYVPNFVLGICSGDNNLHIGC